MSNEMTVVSTAISDPHRVATNAAGTCKEIVLRTAQNIQGRKYVRVEGWQAIANAFGCVASSRNVERVEGGIRAIGMVRRMADGQVIAEAEGFVGDDEKTWANRNEFARRAMAQTRAISRACRSAFAFVVTLMDAGLETTPAEEMDHVEPHREPVVVRPKFPEVEPQATASGGRPKFEDRPDDAAARVDAIRAAIDVAATKDDLKKIGGRIAKTTWLTESEMCDLDASIKERRSDLEQDVVDAPESQEVPS